jgi:hypothetical protein
MNGLKSRTNGDVRTSDQLPTPSSTPEPDDLASQREQHNDVKTHAPPQDVSNPRSPALGAVSQSRRASFHEEAMLSDASEKIRPIKRPGDVRRKSSVSDHDKVLKLSPRQIQELTSEPASIPIRAATPIAEDALGDGMAGDVESSDGQRVLGVVLERPVQLKDMRSPSGEKQKMRSGSPQRREKEIVLLKTPATELRHRPGMNSRSATTPVIRRMDSSTRSRAQSTQMHDR